MRPRSRRLSPDPAPGFGLETSSSGQQDDLKAVKYPGGDRATAFVVQLLQLRRDSLPKRLAQRHPKVFIRYIDVGHGGCDSFARFRGKKFVPRVQYATHINARRSVEHALLLTY